MRIRQVLARRIWDSRGRPTVEVEVVNEDGTRGLGLAPAGASRGTREAVELRDGGDRFKGLDVRRTVEGIAREIAPVLIGREVEDQAGIDAALIALDGTPNKARLGGNALIATSLAVLHAAAASAGLPLWRYLAPDRAVALPLPQIQIFGGGAHAGRRVDVQDFMVIANGAASFERALEMTAEVYRCAGELMAARGPLAGVADEGGWWPAFSRNEEALDTLVGAIEKAGLVPGSEVSIALDIAASEFGRGGRYRLALENRELDSDALCERLVRWTERYPIVSIEDPLAEDDEQGLAAFTRAVGHRVQVVGDDYLVTSADRVRHAASAGACNAVLIKPNQAGTVTETRAALQAARDAGYATIVSARSGETEDVAIVHLATGWNAGQLKVGSFARSERMAKWNEGIRIEQREGLPFAGPRALARMG
ncbi:phosphopyruvate hydratase [Ramlibacter tataouinensis]|uniref:Enolase n=1 Tax=Ramlibacter tataouinensis TaxID=94132 RepID=A0A127JYU1_9BURK|nr:phosphopyruvate hydratase [Ramlibacter tataouinensis]AMO25147.1 phosphopyruvate hydratase [Ramlibacter tataouinensis]